MGSCLARAIPGYVSVLDCFDCPDLELYGYYLEDRGCPCWDATNVRNGRSGLDFGHIFLIRDLPKA